MTSEHEAGLPIRTPDQRLRVFVSSTLAELADERAAVARAITALRLTPVMFELGARPHPPQDLYRAYLAQSDIFVGLYWQHYGWVGPGMDISGLEDEFQLSGSLPRLLYLKRPAPDREPRLSSMIADIEASGSDAYRSFATPRELDRLVRDDLALLLSERFATSNRVVAQTSPPSIAVTPARRSIPATSTSLIGRHDDIEAVSTLLDAGDTRLVTLTGPGGIGKTRLAMAVGDALEQRSARRALFVPLASIAQPELVLPRIAAIAGATIEGNRLPLDVLIEHFAGTDVLLILDNLEQVVAVAPELDQLLTACPHLKILATSRTVLRLRAEREFAVAALTVPSQTVDASVEQVASFAAVQLFIDRARAVRHDFSLTRENASAVIEICRRLDGLPLAIELAAARTRLLDPAALLGRLERVLDSLGTGPVDLPERQRTLRATVEWSIDLLDSVEQQLLFDLSVFSDGWTLAAATTVSAHTEDQTLDLLDALAAHSLVSIEPGARQRFRMLVSVQELAAERLAGSARRDVVQARHAAYFAALVESDDWRVDGQTEWAERLRAEEQNLRGAIRWFFTHDVTVLPHLLRSLWLFWQLSDRMPEGWSWVSELRRHTESFDELARAEVLFTWCVTAVEVGDDDSALEAVNEIEVVVGTIDDPRLASALQLAVAWTLPIVDDLDGALAAAAAALGGFREQNEPFVAFALLTVGMLNITVGRDDLAREHLLEVAELGDRFGNTWLTSGAGTQLALLAARAGDLGEARALLAAAVDSIEDANVSTLTVTFALVACAQIALAEGDALRAATALGAAEALRKRAGLRAWPLSRRGEADLAANLAELADATTVTAGRSVGSELDHRGSLAFVRET